MLYIDYIKDRSSLHLKSIQEHARLGLEAALEVCPGPCQQAFIEHLLARIHRREGLLEAAKVLGLLNVPSMLPILPALICLQSQCHAMKRYNGKWQAAPKGHLQDQEMCPVAAYLGTQSSARRRHSESIQFAGGNVVGNSHFIMDASKGDAAVSAAWMHGSDGQCMHE